MYMFVYVPATGRIAPAIARNRVGPLSVQSTSIFERFSANRYNCIFFTVIIFIIKVHKRYNAFHNTLFAFLICGVLHKFENLIMGYVLHWYFQTEKIVISKIYNI